MKRTFRALAWAVCAFLILAATGCGVPIADDPDASNVEVEGSDAALALEPTPTVMPLPAPTPSETPAPTDTPESSPTPEPVPFTLAPRDEGGLVYAAQIGNLWVYADGWGDDTLPGIYAIELDAPPDVEPRRLWTRTVDFLVCGERILFLDNPDAATPIRGILIDPRDGSVQVINKRQSEFYIPYYSNAEQVWFPHGSGMLAVLNLADLTTRDVYNTVGMFGGDYPPTPIGRTTKGETLFISYKNLTQSDAYFPANFSLWIADDYDWSDCVNDLPGDFSTRIVGNCIVQPTVLGDNRKIVLHRDAQGIQRIIYDGNEHADSDLFIPINLFPGYALGTAQEFKTLSGEPVASMLIGEDRIYPLTQSFSRRPQSYNGLVVPYDDLMESDGIPIIEYPILR